MADLGVRVRDDTAVARAAKRVVAVPAVSRSLTRVLPTVDRAALRLTRGRRTATEVVTGLPTVFLTTRGARSGLPRTVPLIAVPLVGGRHDGDLAVIGSNWGGPSHPAWVRNLAADPRVTVAHGRHTVTARAVPLRTGDAEEVWATATRMYAGYATYRRRARDRDIRVFALTAVGEDGAP